MPTPTSTSSSSGGPTMPVAYEGPLSGLLERISGNFGVNWRYDGSVISINRYETRVFAVEALPGSQNISEGMQDLGSSSGGGSSGGGSSSGGSSSSATQQTDSLTQSSKFSLDIRYWDELEKVLDSMISGNGTVVISPSLGTVTVTTTPEVMKSVADYLAQENQRISRQIAVNVEIYTVTLTNGLDFNLAFNTALRRLTNFGANFAGAGAPTDVSNISGGGALSLAILNPNQISQLGDGTNFTHPTGQITDVFTALSGIGNTTKVARFPLITLNNRPVSRRFGTNISYVQSSTTTTIGSTVSATPAVSLVPGTIQQGFSVQLTPRLLDDGRILLQYSLSIQDVVSIANFNSASGTSSDTTATAGSSTIQLPTTSIRDFVQQSVLKSGSTLIIGGAEEDDRLLNSQGVTDPDNYALGGGISSGRAHSMIFFVLTPQVLDVPHSEQE
jgi:type IVB pilus formation R64 PilN family outer membrane protein